MFQDDNEKDSILWQAFLDGDKNAYARIYELHAKSMYTYGLHFTSDSELIEDAIHDIFVRIYKNRNKLSPVANIKVYLFIALKNTVINTYNKKNETFQLDLAESTLSTERNIEEQIIHSEQSDFRKRLISSMERILSSRQKQAIYYRYVEQLSYKEIAEIMEINVQSAKNIIQVSIKKIRAEFPGTSSSLITFYVISMLISHT